MNEAMATGELAVNSTEFENAIRTLVRATAACASYCEHVEHNEPTTTHGVVNAAVEMRETAMRLARASRLSLRDAYAERIRTVERGSILRYSTGHGDASLLGADALARSQSWDEVQIAQLLHDRQFHPDVFGLSKVDQLRHYTFHVAKLTGLLADSVDTDSWASFRDKRLADIAIFGVKLATVCNDRLPTIPLDELTNCGIGE